MVYSEIYILLDIGIILTIGIIADKISKSNQRFPRLILLLLGGFFLTLLGQYTVLGEFLETITDKHFIAFLGELTLSLVLFREGLELNLRSFFKNLKPVLLLAFVGLIITSILFASIISVLTHMPFLVALLVAGILAPTDPAATFSIFKGGLKINPKEKEILGSESALNDAVAIVLVTTVFVGSVIKDEIDFNATILLNISTSFFGGILLGIILGVSFLKINTKLENRRQTNLISLALVLLSFALATYFHEFIAISAAITALTSGAVFANPEIFKFDQFSHKHLHEFQANTSEFAELLAFTTMGLLITTDDIVSAILIGLLLAITINVARFISIVGILRYPCKFTLKESIFISWGGMRGIATGVLAIIAYINIEDVLHPNSTFSANLFLNSIFFGLIFTSALQGLTIKYVGKKTGSIKIADKRSEYRVARRIVTSKLAFYKQKLDNNEITKSTYQSNTIPLRDELSKIVTGLELEKKNEMEKIRILIHEYELKAAVLSDGRHYRDIVKSNNQTTFYIEEELDIYESEKDKIFEQLLIRLDIIRIKREEADSEVDIETISQMSEIFDYAIKEIGLIKDKYKSQNSENLYNKACEISGIDNNTQTEKSEEDE